MAGQYTGFAALLAITVAAAFGATFLPESALAYLSFLPLALGLRAAWQVWRDRNMNEDEQETEPRQADPRTLQVATVTFANGSDDIESTVPVFAKSGAARIAVYVVAFLILVAVWCAAGWYFATRAAVARLLGRWGHIL